uniref:Ketosynthase family 3 (KS3) domain-containing protein n=1 Tax=Timema douglasi TaxID=61478 RepID=A0A7R8VI98_TIMDO|nr:unnamed protein product [Timema douglasi]
MGPSYAYVTNETAGLDGITMAYEAIKAGRCVGAVVGTVNLVMHPESLYQHNKLNLLSKDGQCRSFDADCRLAQPLPFLLIFPNFSLSYVSPVRSFSFHVLLRLVHTHLGCGLPIGDGFARSDSCVVLYLQKARDAKRIYATVVHSDKEFFGDRKAGLVRPLDDPLISLLTRFYDKCGIDPSEIVFLEANGCGVKTRIHQTHRLEVKMAAHSERIGDMAFRFGDGHGRDELSPFSPLDNPAKEHQTHRLENKEDNAPQEKDWEILRNNIHDAMKSNVYDEEEFKAIEKVLLSRRQTPLLVGSVKSNLGHSDAASALCSVAKVLIAMETGYIPPNLNYNKPASFIPALLDGRIKNFGTPTRWRPRPWPCWPALWASVAASPLNPNTTTNVMTEKTKWDGGLVALNSIGVTGSYAHTLLRSYTKDKPQDNNPKDGVPRIVCVSGRTEEGITKVIDKWGDPFFRYALTLVCRVLARPACRIQCLWHLDELVALQRRAWGHQSPRIHEMLKSMPVDIEFIRLLHDIHSSNIINHNYRGYILLPTDGLSKVYLFAGVLPGEQFLVQPMLGVLGSGHFNGSFRPLWFVFSGMGSQWVGMGQQLMKLPVLAATLEKCHNILVPFGIDLLHILTTDDSTIFNNILHSFVGIASIQMALVELLRLLNIVPDGLIGHSVGELGCAYADGCFSAEQMILAAYYRGMASLETELINGSMAAVGLSFHKVKDLCPPGIDIACHNSGESSTISGPTEVINKFVAELKEKGIFAKAVNVSNIAYHSRYIKPAAPKLLEYLKKIIPYPKPRSSKWFSTSVPESDWDSTLAKFSSAEYHTNNLLSSVLFEETSKHIPKHAITIEIAPHGLLQAILRRSLGPDCVNISLTQRGNQHGLEFLLNAVGKMYLHGICPRVHELYPVVKYPVSRGTPSIGSLVSWDHTDSWHTASLVDMHKEFATQGLWHNHITILETSIIFVVVPRRPLVTGQIRIPENAAAEFSKNISVPSEDSTNLTGEDVYSELKHRGYHYSGQFKGILNAQIGQEGSTAVIEWSNDWLLFLDSLIQLAILHKGEDSQQMQLPLSFQKVIIDPLRHPVKREQKAVYQKFSNILTCGGVEIRGIELFKPTTENYNSIKLDTFRFLSHSNPQLKLLIENHAMILYDKIEIVEIISKDVACSLGPRVNSIFKSYPRVKFQLNTVSSEKILQLNKDKQISLILANKDTAKQAASITNGAFLLARFETSQELIFGQELIVIIQQQFEDGYWVLMKKVVPVNDRSSVIHLSTEALVSPGQLRSSLNVGKDNGTKVYVVAQNQNIQDVETFVTHIYKNLKSEYARLNNVVPARAVRSIQRNALLRLTGTYRTVATDALNVAQGVWPLDLLVKKRAIGYWKRKNNWEKVRILTSPEVETSEDAVFALLREWQRRWEGSETGRRAYQLFPNVVERIDNAHLEPSPGLVQFITGKGPYPESLRKMGLVDPICVNAVRRVPQNTAGEIGVGYPERLRPLEVPRQASNRSFRKSQGGIHKGTEKERRGLGQRLNKLRAREGRGGETFDSDEDSDMDSDEDGNNDEDNGGYGDRNTGSGTETDAGEVSAGEYRERNKERCREVANMKPCGTGIIVRLMDPEVYWGSPGNFEESSFQSINAKDEGKETGRMGGTL